MSKKSKASKKGKGVRAIGTRSKLGNRFKETRTRSTNSAGYNRNC